MMPPDKHNRTARELLDASLTNAEHSLCQTAEAYAPEPEINEVGRIRTVSRGRGLGGGVGQRPE